MNDGLRAVSFAALAAALFAYVPYRPVALKCLSAGLLGYSAADVIVCLTWYSWGPVSYAAATLVQALGFIGMSVLYLRRELPPSAQPEPSRIYCLRRYPKDAQGLVIAALGLFGPAGSYAIYCRGWVYLFQKGRLRRVKYDDRVFSAYHCVRGAPARDDHVERLDAMISKPWRLFGANCITLLGRFWRQYGRGG